MSGAFETNVAALRSYEAELRSAVEELRDAFPTAAGPDLTGLPDGSAGGFAESATFVARYRVAAQLLWSETVAVLAGLDDAARTLGDVLDRYEEQEQETAAAIRAIYRTLDGPG